MSVEIASCFFLGTAPVSCLQLQQQGGASGNSVEYLQPVVIFKHIHIRWAWQSLPVLQLPPVDSSSNNSNGELLRPRPRSLLARVENRILQVKEGNQVESVLKTAEQVLHLRRK